MKVLFVTQEMDPYTLESEITEIFKKLPQSVNDKNHEIRVLMPKYGLINERRHRLHEVVRLSGMNIIVNDEDYPLIIKVASVPSARIQVYFLDNEEFFKRKNMFKNDDETGFDDNAERMVFFCKGALETVRKFGWPPDVIHCHGSFTALIPLFVQKVYQNDPIFKFSKVVYSTYTDTLSDTLNKGFIKLAAISDITEKDLAVYFDKDHLNLNAGAIHYSHAIAIGNESLDGVMRKSAGNKPILGFVSDLAERNTKTELFYNEITTL
jgi:starch synthase